VLSAMLLKAVHFFLVKWSAELLVAACGYASFATVEKHAEFTNAIPRFTL
jgi:hypothetical protein